MKPTHCTISPQGIPGSQHISLELAEAAARRHGPGWGVRAIGGSITSAPGAAPSYTTPDDIQRAIQASPEATARVLRWLELRGRTYASGRRYGKISGASLGAVCSVTDRTWRRWVAGIQPFPGAARDLLSEVAGLK